MFSVAVLLIASGCSTGALQPPPAAVASTAIPCSQISDLRALGTSLAQVTNAKTGDSMEYTVIGDGAVSDDVLVMFPGTGQILTGWPVQMLTNSAASPKIVGTAAYDALEDGPVSLCHDYHILLFDYPGVGLSPLNGNVTRDMISSDVDAMLQDAASRYGIATNVVDPVGWSLGTANASKFAVLSPVSRPARTIHNVILIAAAPGGSRQAQVGPNSASCVTTMFGAALTATGLLDADLKTKLTELIFPYLGQTQAQSGTNSGCTATIGSNTVSLSVTPDCGIVNHCAAFIAGSIIDLDTYPWSLTKGIDENEFAQQRELANDFDVAYCSGAGSDFTYTGCSAFGPVKMSTQNGGICESDTSDPDVPVASSCDRLTMTGKLTVINGYEDLLTQWTYGKALVDAYNAEYGAGTAVLDTYPGAAGHGVMIQHPEWTQLQIKAAMTN